MTQPRRHTPEDAAAAAERAERTRAERPEPETEPRAGHRGTHAERRAGDTPDPKP